MRWFYGHEFKFFLIPKIVSLIILIAIIGAAIYLFKNHRLLQPVTRRENDPLDILKERYARGEISDEDFDRMKGKLNI